MIPSPGVRLVSALLQKTKREKWVAMQVYKKFTATVSNMESDLGFHVRSYFEKDILL